MEEKLEIQLTQEEAQILRAFLPANPNKLRGFDSAEREAKTKAVVWKLVNALDAIARDGTA